MMNVHLRDLYWCALWISLIYRPFPGAKRKVLQSCGYWLWGVGTGSHYQGPRSSRMRSGFTHNAESWVERFTVTPCSEKLVTICTTYHYASEKTSAVVLFTLRRLNSPRITIEKRGTTRLKTLKYGNDLIYSLVSVSLPDGMTALSLYYILIIFFLSDFMAPAFSDRPDNYDLRGCQSV